MAFDFIGYFAVPFLTVALSRETALFSTNFSSIRTANHRQGEFLVWSFFLLIYLLFCFLPFFYRRSLPRRRKWDGMLLLFLGCGLLLLTSVFTPYLPREEPFLSQIHVYASVWSAVSFFFFLVLAVLPVYFHRQREGRVLFCLLTAAAAFCASSYLITGIVNSAMEIVYTLTCCTVANRLHLFFSAPSPKRL